MKSEKDLNVLISYVHSETPIQYGSNPPPTDLNKVLNLVSKEEMALYPEIKGEWPNVWIIPKSEE